MRILALLMLVAAVVGCGGTSSSSDGGSIDDGGKAGGDLALVNPVHLRNATYSFDGTLYTIQFVVDDSAYPTRTIASIDDLSLLWPGGYADTAGFHCAQTPWIVSTEMTGPIELQLGAGGATTLLFVSCGDPNTQQPFNLQAMAAPVPGDSILVEVDGKLDDATPFRAVTAANTP